MMTSRTSTPTRRNRILAFDPGFERLGVAVVERDPAAHGGVSLIFSDCLRTPGTVSFSERLRLLGEEIERIVETFAPDGAALEEVFFEKNQKTAMDVAAVRGMLSYIAASRGLIVHEYTPMEVKVAVTGYGRASKSDILSMIPKLLYLPEKKRLDDELDAIAVGITCLASTRP